MYLPSRVQGVYGLGITYDADGLPVEDPANTTYGASSGGACPGSPGCPAAGGGTVQRPAVSITDMLNQYATPLMFAAGALLLLVMVKRR